MAVEIHIVGVKAKIETILCTVHSTGSMILSWSSDIVRFQAGYTYSSGMLQTICSSTQVLVRTECRLA